MARKRLSRGDPVNELVTNAVKYAFPDGQGGQSTLDMRGTGPTRR